MTSYPQPAAVRPSRSLPLAAALLALAGSCTSTPPKPQPASAHDKEAHKELTADEFRALLAKGTITPIESMQGDDPYKGVSPEMDELAAPHNPAGKPSVPGAAQHPKNAPTVSQPENPYSAFGERIKVNPDGTITKPYPLRVGTGKRMMELIQKYGNFPMWAGAAGAGPSTPDTVLLETMDNWDVEFYQDLRNPAIGAATSAPLADWLIVTTGSELLHEVEDFINLFAAGVPQIEIEAKIVEISLTDTLDLGVTTPPGVPMFDFGPSGFIKSLDSKFGNLADASEGLLTLGGVSDGVTFNAIIEALATNDNVSIISRPKIAVREGGRADISNILKIPYLAIGQIQTNGAFTSTIAYQEVGVKLYVVPRVVGTATVALNIDVEASNQSGSEAILSTGDGSANNTVVSVPVLSTRGAHTTVYLQPGQAVILGGLITERNAESVRKVPFLGDIPVLGLLFRSKFTRHEQTNVLFFIRPRILQGIDLNREF
jgi:type II secretory pathway component GspD/PulD (secretin)